MTVSEWTKPTHYEPQLDGKMSIYRRHINRELTPSSPMLKIMFGDDTFVLYSRRQLECETERPERLAFYNLHATQSLKDKYVTQPLPNEPQSEGMMRASHGKSGVGAVLITFAHDRPLREQSHRLYDRKDIESQVKERPERLAFIDAYIPVPLPPEEEEDVEDQTFVHAAPADAKLVEFTDTAGQFVQAYAADTPDHGIGYFWRGKEGGWSFLPKSTQRVGHRPGRARLVVDMEELAMTANERALLEELAMTANERALRSELIKALGRESAEHEKVGKLETALHDALDLISHYEKTGVQKTARETSLKKEVEKVLDSLTPKERALVEARTEEQSLAKVLEADQALTRSTAAERESFIDSLTPDSPTEDGSARYAQERLQASYETGDVHRQAQERNEETARLLKEAEESSEVVEKRNEETARSLRTMSMDGKTFGTMSMDGPRLKIQWHSSEIPTSYMSWNQVLNTRDRFPERYQFMAKNRPKDGPGPTTDPSITEHFYHGVFGTMTMDWRKLKIEWHDDELSTCTMCWNQVFNCRERFPERYQFFLDNRPQREPHNLTISMMGVVGEMKLVRRSGHPHLAVKWDDGLLSGLISYETLHATAEKFPERLAFFEAAMMTRAAEEADESAPVPTEDEVERLTAENAKLRDRLNHVGAYLKTLGDECWTLADAYKKAEDNS